MDSSEMLSVKYVLMYSRVDLRTHATQFIVGSFDGKSFIQEKRATPEAGPQFYAPQTFDTPDGRRIMIGWFYDWRMKPEEGLEYAGALTLPRELELDDDKLLVKPIREAGDLAVDSDENVIITDKKVTVIGTSEGDMEYVADINRVDIYRDGKGIEIFINNGEKSISAWLT